MKPTELAEKIDQAIGLTTQLMRKDPGRSGLPIILKQLLDLQATYARNRRFDTVASNALTMGVIAAKSEYDVIYPEYADLIHDITYAIRHPDRCPP